MADEKPTLQIDTDWKKQAQEEKRRLAEQEEKRQSGAASPARSTAAMAPPTRGAAARPAARDVPPASFASLVQSLLTQTLFYLGDLAGAGGEGGINLDMARRQLDTLAVLDDKTKGNLNGDEKQMLDTALYESRTRFVNVASQYL